LSLRTFCPAGHFVFRMFCLRGRFVPEDVLSHWMFCPKDVLSIVRFVSGCFVSGRFVPEYVLSQDVLSLSRESTTSAVIRSTPAGLYVSQPEGRLNLWLESPVLNWNRPLKILEDVKTLCEQSKLPTHLLTL
jgi:hypothetical protein